MDPRQTIDFLSRESWKEKESTLAARLRLRIEPASTQTRNILREELKSSVFSIADVERILESDRELVFAFAASWFADRQVNDHGEEWDPAEGNQQEDNEAEPKDPAFGEGFLVGYCLLYLYAKERPADLSAYLKRRRFPHAAKVRKDLIRVYNGTIAASAD